MKPLDEITHRGALRYPVGISPPNLWLATPIRHQFFLSIGFPQSVDISHFFALTTQIPLF